MSAQLDHLVPELRDAARDLLNAAAAAGLQPRITSTLRSYAEQKRLYDRFLAGQQGFPVLPPGYSAHEYGEAFDMVVSPMEALADVGYTWQTWGGGWNPGDAIHFELPGASSRAQAAGRRSDNPVSNAAQAFADLPWYAQIALPVGVTTESSNEAQINKKLCAWFGINCGS